MVLRGESEQNLMGFMQKNGVQELYLWRKHRIFRPIE